jgi:hypothetical protein
MNTALESQGHEIENRPQREEEDERRKKAFSASRTPQFVIPGDEDLARCRAWLHHCPRFIRKAYKTVREIDWICPCVVCTNKTHRLALVRKSPLNRRTVAYVCPDCISHPRFQRIYHPEDIPRKERRQTEKEEQEEGEEDDDEESTPTCPMTVLKWCGMS